MRAPGVLYLVGMALIFLAERLVGGGDTLRIGLDAIGGLVLLASLGMVGRELGSASPAEKGAHQAQLLAGAVGLASLLVYLLQTDMVLDLLAFGDDASEQKYQAVISALWPIVWLCGTLPYLAIDRWLSISPLGVVPFRVRQQGLAALSFGLALALMVPLNWLGSELNQRWDLGYFKTASAGTSTQALVAGLDEPVTAYLFFPGNSDVTGEVRGYFQTLSGDNFTVEVVDHALEPELSKELKIRDNGYVAFVRGEGEEQQVERLKIGKDFDSARRVLKKLDQEARKSLLKVGRGQKVAYVTIGHGELYWTGVDQPEDKIANLKKVLQALNYRVKELGLAEGLASGVPDDAAIVMVLGPKSDFQPEELVSLDSYRKAGGSLMVALEPGGPDVSTLLGPLGVSFDGTRTLAHETKFVPRTYKLIDRVNLVTNKYSTHPSVTTLARNNRALVSIFSGAGTLQQEDAGKAPGASTTVTIRTLNDTFADVDGDLEFDKADGEEQNTFNLAIASSGPAPDGEPLPVDEGQEPVEPEFRAVVFSDATWMSDLALVLDPNKGNFQMFMDSLAWLSKEDALAGTTGSEEDVKIEHTKAGQGWIFYGTSFLVPFGFLGLGFLRIRMRKAGGSR